MHQSDQICKKITISHQMKFPDKLILMGLQDLEDQMEGQENLADLETQDRLEILVCLVALATLDPQDPSLTFNLSWTRCSSPLEAKKDLHLILSPT